MNKNFDHCSLRWYSNVLRFFLQLICWTSVTSKWFYMGCIFVSALFSLVHIWLYRLYDKVKNKNTIDFNHFVECPYPSNIYIHFKKIHVKGNVQKISVNKFCATDFPKLEDFKIKRVANTQYYVVTPSDVMRFASRKLCLLTLSDKH